MDEDIKQRIRNAGMIPVRVDGEIVGMKKGKNSLQTLADSYGYFCDDFNGFYFLYKRISGSMLCYLPVCTTDFYEITSAAGMFSGCRFEEVDLSGFDTSNVYGMQGMFLACRNLRVLNVSGWDTRNVTNMGRMFYGCSKLISLDLSSWNTKNVTNMYRMFDQCYSLEVIDLSNFSDESLESSDNMFNDCVSLYNIIHPGGSNGLGIVKLATEQIELNKRRTKTGQRLAAPDQLEGIKIF